MALIETHDLTKFYRMGDSVVHALDGVDLTIEKGEFLAITGASGSGKSTMMHLLGCLDRPTSGHYLLEGRDVSSMSDRELADTRNKAIGFVFQTFNLINRTTAWENVAVPLFYARQSRTREPAMRALKRVGLLERASHQPNELSGGERQRVAIARAMVNDPVLLMADEPTGNLDTRTGEQIMRIFRDLNAQGVTVVMVTHEWEIAMQTQRIVQMRDGKIIADRSTDEIRRSEGAAPVHPVAQPAAIAPEAVPVDVSQDAEPTAGVSAAEDDAARMAAMPARMMRGARGAMICGIVGLGLLALGIGAQVFMQLAYGEELKALAEAQQMGQNPVMPPVPIIIGGMSTCVSMAGAIVLAIIAIVLGARARRRIRVEPGNWLGRGRALAGILLGIGTIAVPVVWTAINIVVTTLKG